MNLRLICLVMVTTLAALGNNLAQTKDQDDLAGKLLIDKEKPSVYISFEKSGSAPRLFKGESSDRLWLRLHNNTRGGISFCYFNVAKQYGDIAVRFDVQEESSFESSRLPKVQIPGGVNIEKKEAVGNGYVLGDSCLLYHLSSGNSVQFSVPAIHLLRDGIAYRIVIPFAYGWETESTPGGPHPRHTVAFLNANVPSRP